MIDITPYQERLQWLKEWMNIIIQDNIKPIMLCENMLYNFYWEAPHVRKIYSFEEYCAFKQSSK